jgi:hypothetical protein
MNRRFLLRATSFLALANFIAFILIATLIGGDALNGHTEYGRFLRQHGTLTEVSWAVFIYSKLHALSLFVTHPLAMWAGWAVWVSRK